MFHFYTPFRSIVSQYVLVQLCACRNVVIYHQQVQLLFAVLLAYCGKQHTVRLDAHHGSWREVSDGNEGLAYQLFRLIVCMNAGKDGTVGAGSVVQGEL